MISLRSWVDLATFICMYRPKAIFWDSNLKNCASPSLLKKLLIWRNRRYRTTKTYISHANWSINIKFMYEKLFYLRYHEIWHELFFKAAPWYLKKFSRSDHYRTYKQNVQNFVFVKLSSRIEFSLFGKGFLASVQPKFFLTLCPDFRNTLRQYCFT